MARQRTRLDRNRVLDAAVSLADQNGIDALTMRQLADGLGVEAMSLYHYFSNKDEILDGMVDRIVGEIELPSPDDDWKTAMRRRAISAHDVFDAHPWSIALMETRTNPGPAALKYYDAVIGCLRDAGFRIDMVAHAFSAIDAYIYGFSLQEQSLPFEDEHDVKDVAEDVLDQFPTDDYPNLAAMIVEHALQPGYRYADEFVWGLDLILDGFERLLEAH